MLLELAIGDAYGAGFEYADREFVAANNTLERYVKHPRHAIAPGRYTDDTQMTLAIAEALVEGDPWTPQSLAARFVAVFKRDPREGYAGGFHAFLTGVRSGDEFLGGIRPTSDKSGAAMRAAPLGVLRTRGRPRPARSPLLRARTRPLRPRLPRRARSTPAGAGRVHVVGHDTSPRDATSPATRPTQRRPRASAQGRHCVGILRHNARIYPAR